MKTRQKQELQYSEAKQLLAQAQERFAAAQEAAQQAADALTRARNAWAQAFVASCSEDERQALYQALRDEGYG